MKKIILLSLSLIPALLVAQEDISSMATTPVASTQPHGQVKDLDTLIKQMERNIALFNFLDDLCRHIIENDKPYFATEQAKEEALGNLADLCTKAYKDKQEAIDEINTAIQTHNSSPADHVACKQLQEQLQTFETAFTAALSKLAEVEAIIKNVPVLDMNSIQDSHTRELGVMVAHMDLELWKYRFLHNMVQLARDPKYLSAISLTNDEKLAVGILSMLVATAITESARKTALECMTKLNECCSSQPNSVLCEELRQQLNEFEIAVNNALREGRDYITDLINRPEAEQSF